MTSIFEVSDWREYLKGRFEALPKGGYGQAKRLADHLGVHTTLVSQILKGLKPLTLEQAVLVGEFLGLSDLEAEHFVLLVQLERAGNEPLRKMVAKQIEASRAKSRELVNRVSVKKKLSTEEKAVFYSDWSYSAIRQMTAIEGHQTAEAISKSLDLPLKETADALRFLLSAGLVVDDGKQIRIGPTSTHLESTSPWVRSNELNWRLKSIEAMKAPSPSSLRYTGPMTLSRKDAMRVRELLTLLIEQVHDVVDPSPSEELHCLNIDWFKVNR